MLGLGVVGLPQVHEHGDEGGLSVGGQQRHHLVLDGLHAPADLLQQPRLHHLPQLVRRDRGADGVQLLFHAFADLLPADVHEGGQVGQGDGLAAVLVGGHLGDDLGGDVAGGGEGVGLFNQGAGDDGAVLQHVLQVHQVAVVHVLGVIVGIVEVDDAGVVGLHDLGGQKKAVGDVPADLAGHIVPLDGVHRGVFVAVLLLGLFVVALNEGEDLVVGGVASADEGAGVAIGDVTLGHLKGAMGHDLVFHQVLNLLHGGRPVQFLTGKLHGLGDPADLHGRHADGLRDALIGLGNGRDDLGDVKTYFRAVPFDNVHGPSPHLVCRLLEYRSVF